MTWTDRINGNPIEWLLNSPAPEIRDMALGDLMDVSSDDPRRKTARQEAISSGNTRLVLSHMEPEGYWVKPGPGYGPKYKSTVWAVSLLGQLGAKVTDDPRIETACRYVLDNAMAEQGQMTYNGAKGGTFDCLQGNLTKALLQMGCTDPRLDLAAEWTAATVTGEGIAPITEKKAEKRFTAYKCGPNFACGANNKMPCAWGAAKVMLALSLVPVVKRTPLIQSAIWQGVEFFLGIDPVTAEWPTTTGKPSRDWWMFGFPVYYVTDLLQVAEALTTLGYGNDPRMTSLLELILSKQDENGRWALEYRYGSKTWGNYGKEKIPNEWVTLRALRVLKQAVSSQ
jgi:hypothetical protein